jgi:multidrug efflux pump subunit AcrB
MEFGGENEERNDAFTSMIVPSILAIALIYLILVMQFGDLREPFIIMGTIPLSFIGIIWGLKFTGYPIGFMALLGAISLMGVVVNNGIVILDYIKLLIKDNDDIKDAIVTACSVRTRPIIIGMITTVISLIPLAISGGDLWAPMATTIIFGMIFSSFLTMLVIPCAYLVVEGEKSLIKKFTEYLRSK